MVNKKVLFVGVVVHCYTLYFLGDHEFKIPLPIRIDRLAKEDMDEK